MAWTGDLDEQIWELKRSMIIEHMGHWFWIEINRHDKHDRDNPHLYEHRERELKRTFAEIEEIEYA